MAASDWNTVTSDLQRAVNNLAWFVLESMTLPEQAHFMVPLPLDTLSAQPPPVEHHLFSYTNHHRVLLIHRQM